MSPTKNSQIFNLNTDRHGLRISNTTAGQIRRNNLNGTYVPLFEGITSGFLSSFSNRSSDSERNGRVAFSFTARKPGLRALEPPSLRDALIFKAPRITTVTKRRAVTIPIKIPRIGAISNWSRVPKDNTGREKFTINIFNFKSLTFFGEP